MTFIREEKKRIIKKKINLRLGHMSSYNRKLGRKAGGGGQEELPAYISRPAAAAAAAAAAAPASPPPPQRRQVARPRQQAEDDDNDREEGGGQKKRNTFRFSPPVSRTPQQEERKAVADATDVTGGGDGQSIQAAVPKLADDLVNPDVHWKDIHGIKMEEIAQIDKSVRARRFKPGDDTLERVCWTIGTYRNEQNFSSRQLATFLFKGGIKSIWIKGDGGRTTGRNYFFFGTEAQYVDTMKRIYAKPEWRDEGHDVSVGAIFNVLSDMDMPTPPKKKI